MPIYLKYYFWLFGISLLVFALERWFPWRRGQDIVRPGFVQDLFWLAFNTQYLSWMLALFTAHAVAWFNGVFLHLGVPTPDSLHLIAHWPVWLQFAVVFLARDFLEWNIHRWLHVLPWLWRFHQLHHSSEQLDWAATFRAHWGEVIIYQTLIYLPLVVLGANEQVIFASLVLALLVQEISHANLNWDFGPLRYIVNSPRFHAWHHAIEMHGRGGQNFGVSLVIWDWLFRTAYWPGRSAAPGAYGFAGMEQFPSGVWARFWQPFRRNRKRPAGYPPAEAVSSAK